MKYLFSICLLLYFVAIAHGQDSLNSKDQRRESFEEKRARSNMFSLMGGVNFRQERYSIPIVYKSAIAGPGEHLNIGLTRNRFYSYTRLNLYYNEFKERFKKVKHEHRFISDWQTIGIKTFTLGVARGTYLKGLTGGRRILSLEVGANVSFSDSKSSISEHYEVSGSSSFLEVTGYSLGSFPLVHIGLGTSVRLFGLAYWDFSVTYYQGLVRMYQYTYNYHELNGYNGYTEHTSNGSYLSIKTGISLALIN